MKTIAVIISCFLGVACSSLYAANAPVTICGNIPNAVPGTLSVPLPVTVFGFNEIGSFKITMTFDTTKVRYVSCLNHPDLPGMKVVYYKPSGNTYGKLIFSWTGTTNVSLTDGSVLSDLTFSYVMGSGLLSWTYTFGDVCQYKRFVNGILSLLADSPKYQFYVDGGIANRGAPVTFAPALTPSGPGALSVPIVVNNFTGIGAMSLSMEYDPVIMTYQNTYLKNPAFGSSFAVGNNPGTGGKMLLTIGWYGNSVTLANGSTLVTLNFNYTGVSGVTSPIVWFDNISSCEYADGSGCVLMDHPTGTYYVNGSITAPLVAGNFIVDKLYPAKNDTVHFTDLSTGGAKAWIWSFDRPGIVFLSGTSVASKNPVVKFTDGGLFTVTLAVQNNYSSDIEVKTDYIRAGLPGIWTGNTSSDWNTLSNWDDYLLPDGGVDVIIPPSAPNWPVFDGDLTLGIHCKNLSLRGTTSHLTVTGDLFIP